jgi:hypothetical protein
LMTSTDTGAGLTAFTSTDGTSDQSSVSGDHTRPMRCGVEASCAAPQLVVAMGSRACWPAAGCSIRRRGWGRIPTDLRAVEHPRGVAGRSVISGSVKKSAAGCHRRQTAHASRLHDERMLERQDHVVGVGNVGCSAQRARLVAVPGRHRMKTVGAGRGWCAYWW